MAPGDFQDKPKDPDSYGKNDRPELIFSAASTGFRHKLFFKTIGEHNRVICPALCN